MKNPKARNYKPPHDFMGEGPAPEVKNPGPIVRIVLIHADGSEEVLPPKGQRIVDFTANCAVVAARGGNS